MLNALGKKTPKAYYKIPQTMFTEGTVSTGAVGLYGEIRLLTQKGTCFATNSYFAQKFSRDTRTIQRWLDELIKEQWINKEFDTQGVRTLKIIDKGDIECPSPHGKNVCHPTTQNVVTHDIECPSPHGKNVTYDNNKYKTMSYNNKYIKEKTNKKEIPHDEEFEKFWKLYPRKVGKKDALEKWNARLAEGVTVEELMNALNNYNRQITENHTEEKYIKHPSTFLSKKRYFDDFKDYHDIREETELSSEKTYKLDLPF